MSKVFLFLLYLLGCHNLYAQQKPAAHFDLPAKNGFYRITTYDTNIFRIAYHPDHNRKTELISDAVHIAPSHSLNRKSISRVGDSLFIKGRLVISGTHDDGAYRGFYFPLGKNEKIFGAGERALPLNRKGYRLSLYNNPWYGYSEGADNLNYSVPFITSSEGYALFFDNPSRGYLDIGKQQEGRLEFGAISGESNVFVIFGNYRQVLAAYHKLTGYQPLPPLWAMGNLMSRFGYRSEKEVQDIYSAMRNNNMPVDAIIYDLFWFGDSIKGTMGNLEWVNRQKWPDPVKMINSFKEKGVQTLLVTEPFFVETSTNYKASLPYLAVDSNRKPYYLTDFYFGKGGLLDIFRNDAKVWFWNFYKKQMDLGVEAWWGDLGEPEKHPADLFHNLHDKGYKRLFAADEVHNLYGHEWTKMLFHQYAKHYPDKRLFSLNRSGFSGSQRFSIFPWTGDVSRNWSGFRAQLPILLGMTMSGVPYVHSDAGGFAGGEGDEELYVRWLQFAAFTPIFRPHGTALYDVEPAAFSFPSEAALFTGRFRDAAGKAIRLRYSFLPYNYTLAYEQAVNGKPLMAPLYYFYSNDTTASQIEDQYMWGEQVLVAPVIHKNTGIRNYYLPEGKWYHFFDGRMLAGKSWISDSTYLDNFPLLIKEGSFVPLDGMFRTVPNTAAYTSDSLVLLYVPSSKPSFSKMYHDDGKSKHALQHKNFELIQFSSTGIKNKSTLIVVRAERQKIRTIKNRQVYLLIPGPPKAIDKVMVNHKMIDLGNAATIVDLPENALIPFVFNGNEVKIRIYWK